jgi:threonine/homoserine/homoserine lactone efflux protein
MRSATGTDGQYGGPVAWSRYGEFVAFVIVLVLIPGPDFAVVARNALAGSPGAAGRPVRAVAWWQGFLSNLTNPKVLVFYLAVLPQFLVYGTGPAWSLLLAWTVPALGFAYLIALVNGMHYARALLMRRRVRRAMDWTTGAALLGFAAALAADST